MNKQTTAAVALVMSLAGIVGGVAYASSSSPTSEPARMVLVPQSTPIVDATTTATSTPTATATSTVAAKPAQTVNPAPVKTRTATSSKPKTSTDTRKAATVAEQPAPESTPDAPKPAPRETGEVVYNEDGSTTIKMKPGDVPPIIPAKPGPEPSPSE